MVGEPSPVGMANEWTKARHDVVKIDAEESAARGYMLTHEPKTILTMLAEIERLQSSVAYYQRREADIIEACERVADGGQYREDIVSAIQRIRRERDEARDKLVEADMQLKINSALAECDPVEEPACLSDRTTAFERLEAAMENLRTVGKRREAIDGVLTAFDEWKVAREAEPLRTAPSPASSILTPVHGGHVFAGTWEDLATLDTATCAACGERIKQEGKMLARVLTAPCGHDEHAPGTCDVEEVLCVGWPKDAPGGQLVKVVRAIVREAPDDKPNGPTEEAIIAMYDTYLDTIGKHDEQHMIVKVPAMKKTGDAIQATGEAITDDCRALHLAMEHDERVSAGEVVPPATPIDLDAIVPTTQEGRLAYHAERLDAAADLMTSDGQDGEKLREAARVLRREEPTK